MSSVSSRGSSGREALNRWVMSGVEVAKCEVVEAVNESSKFFVLQGMDGRARAAA